MLIDSPRITAHDRQIWQSHHRYDRILSGDHRWPSREQAASEAIRQWWATNPDGVCSTSWGKDSVCVAHLVVATGLPIPIVWVRSDPFETPECEHVRDAFLAAHPGVEYREISVPLRNPKRGEPGHEAHVLNGTGRQDVLAEAIPTGYISGVRADESRIRTMSIAHRGLVTRRTCRPIGRWTGADVFAYLHRHDLPVHPAYAMTLGGYRDRQWLRVHPLCSNLPGAHRTDHATWEDTYYKDVIQAALDQRRAWREAGDERGGIHVD